MHSECYEYFFFLQTNLKAANDDLRKAMTAIKQELETTKKNLLKLEREKVRKFGSR